MKSNKLMLAVRDLDNAARDTRKEPLTVEELATYEPVSVTVLGRFVKAAYALNADVLTPQRWRQLFEHLQALLEIADKFFVQPDSGKFVMPPFWRWPGLAGNLLKWIIKVFDIFKKDQ